MSDDPKDGEVFPPSALVQRGLGAVRTQSAVDHMPTANPGGVMSSAVTGFVASLRRSANNSLAADARARADYYEAVGQVAKSYIGMNQALGEVNELDQILALDREERKASRQEREAEIGHRGQVAALRRKQELAEAKRGAFNAAQGYENQKRLKDLNLEIWEKRKEVEHLDAKTVAARLRGDADPNAKKGGGGLLSDLQTLSVNHRKAILEADADGKDTTGDELVHKELDALIDRLRKR